MSTNKKEQQKEKRKELVNIYEGLMICKDDKIVPIRPVVMNEGYYGEEVSREGGIFSDDQKMNKAEFSWVRKNNSFFISAKPNTESIPAGIYDIRESMQHGLFLEKRSLLLDELFIVPDEQINEIVGDLDKFWASKDKYKDYGITYKRGIMLYGEPGTGKTSLLNLMIYKIITERNGIVLNVDSLHSFIPMVQNLRSLESEKPILALIEDLDSFLQYNSTKEFLNVLDGNLQVDNIVYLATTNYIDRLEDRIKNRPSRFDRRYYITYPTPQVREFYFKEKLKPEDLTRYDIAKWVNDTENMSFAHLKELIVSVVVMDGDYDKTIQTLRSMAEVK